MNDWDGTPWEGAVATLPPQRALVRSGASVPAMDQARVVGKAASGAGVNAFYTDIPLSMFQRNPRKMCREAQAAFRTQTWVRVAETAVTRKVRNLPWHLEDQNDDTVPDDAAGNARRFLDLLRKPQDLIDPKLRQPGLNSWVGLVGITSRHMGLCNLAHWYLDQRDDLGPKAILYLNPSRMYPVHTPKGMLLGWKLDADESGEGGTPLTLDEVVTFYLEPPDEGFYGAGLYESASSKVRLSAMIDRYQEYIVASGGRIPGIVSPKEGYISSDDQWNTLVNEFRNANEAPDSAKRTTILRGPVDYQETGGDPVRIGVAEMSRISRDDVLAAWNVPLSQTGVALPAGLNSGETKAYDEAVLMQGPVHDRVGPIVAGIARVLERSGYSIEIEEPEFDDETPAYDRASKATNIPLTRNERRAIVGLDPLPDFAADGTTPLGLAIDLPATIVVVGAGAPDGSEAAPVMEAQPEMEAAPLGATPSAGMASISPAVRLREKIVPKYADRIQERMVAFLREQRAAIVRAVKEKADHLTAKAGRDASAVWGDGKTWDRKLLEALRGEIGGLVKVTAESVGDLLPGKAVAFEDAVLAAVQGDLGSRIAGINETTRSAVMDAIRVGFENGDPILTIAKSIEDLPAFDLSRAELVARTETARAYNAAAVGSYRALGVSEVQAIDGDTDDVCAARNGKVYPVAEAYDIEDHPNGTLDWVPIVGGS